MHCCPLSCIIISLGTSVCNMPYTFPVSFLPDSSNLEIFLEMMNDKEIIIVVAHDDASKK